MPRLAHWLALLTTAIASYVPAAAQTGQIDSLKVTGAFALDIIFLGPTCGAANGTIAVSASAGTAPYQYSLDGGAAGSLGVFTGLASGLHTLLVSDASGRKVTSQVTLTALYAPPTLSVHDYTTPSACLASDATLTINASGGTPPYAYSIDQVNYQAGNVFNNLPNGQYTFFVKDANGCMASANGPLQYNYNCTLIPQGIAVSYSPGACGPNGYIDLGPSTPGEPWPYTFSTDGVNFQTSGTLSNLSPGLIKVYVKDPSGNEFMQGVVIYPNCLLTSATVQAADCGFSNGMIIAQASNGKPPYMYSLDGGATFQYSPVFGGLAPGAYKLFSKDANGTLSGTSAVVGEGCLTLGAVSVNGRCGLDNGSVTGQVVGGYPPYQYSLNGSTFQAPATFTGLGAGMYTITVKDAHGATASTQIPISVAPSPVLSLSGTAVSCASDDGTITALGSGSTGPYTFSLDNVHFATASVFSSLDTGLHKVWVKDAAGCIASDTLTLALLNTLTVDAGSGGTICQGDAIMLYGNSNAAHVTWSPSIGLTKTDTIQTEAYAPATMYYYLKGITGICVDSDSVQVVVNPAPIASAGPPVTFCYGGSGQLSGSGGVQYAWSPAAGLSSAVIADPLVQGLTQSTTYTLQVIDANGCRSKPATVQVTVDPPSPLTVAGDTTVAPGQAAFLSAEAGFTSYTWSPPSGLSNPSISSPVAQPSESTVYTVTASDVAGCEAVGSVTVKVVRGPDIYVPSAFTPNGDGANDILKVTAVGIRSFKEFLVVDRWGKTVFRTVDPSVSWDGAGAPAGVYVWMVAGVDINGRLVQKKGTVVLIR